MVQATDSQDDRSIPLRVAHIIYGLQVGGLEQLVTELAARGRERGLISRVIAFGEDGSLRDVLARRGVPLVYLGPVPGMTRPTLRAISQALDAFGADVAHAHDLGPWLNTAATRAYRRETAVLGTFHQQGPPAGARGVAAIAAARVSHALVACGDQVGAGLDRWASPHTRVLTIGNGVPLRPRATPEERAAARKALGVPEGATVIGYLGRLHEEKGPDRLIEAFLGRFAQRPDVHLVLIGGGPMEAALRLRVARAPNVHLRGEVTEGASGLLAGLDIYAQASRSEGRSLAMLEAMAAALPTVTHDLPSIAEIHPPTTALRVRLGDLVGFGAALARLVEDPALRARMGKAARAAAERFSVDGMVDAYVKLYREATDRSPFRRSPLLEPSGGRPRRAGSRAAGAPTLVAPTLVAPTPVTATPLTATPVTATPVAPTPLVAAPPLAPSEPEPETARTALARRWRTFTADMVRYAGPEERPWSMGFVRKLVRGAYNHPALLSVAVYRYGQWVYQDCRSPLVRSVLKAHYVATFIAVRAFTHVEIPPSAQIGPGLCIYHFTATGVNGAFIAGKNLTLGKCVLVGSDDSGAVPVVGDDVTINAGACLIGGITLGDRVVVGAGAVVVSSFPADAVVGGVPAKLLKARRGNRLAETPHTAVFATAEAPRA